MEYQWFYVSEKHLHTVSTTLLTLNVNSSDCAWLHASTEAVIFKSFGVKEI